MMYSIFLLAACGSGIEGTYEDQNGIAKYTFEKGGKLTTNTMGLVMEMKYEKDGDNIKIGVPNSEAKLIMKLVDKNTITGPMGIRLSKIQ